MIISIISGIVLSIVLSMAGYFVYLQFKDSFLKKVPDDVQMLVESTVGKTKEEASVILSSLNGWKYRFVSQDAIDAEPSRLDRRVHFYLVGINTGGVVKKVWWNDEMVNILGTTLDVM